MKCPTCGHVLPSSEPLSERKRREFHVAQSVTRPRALRHRQQWTGQDLAYLDANRKMPVVDLALALGRTSAAIKCMRALMRDTPSTQPLT